MSISRRSFLKKSTATAAIALSGGIARQVLAAQSPPLTPGPGNKWPGRVVINFNKKAVTDAGKADTAVIKKMVDDAIKLLTGQSTVGAAWKEIFPATLSRQSKIAIKINSANSDLPAPHWASVRAITDGIQEMEIGGTKFPVTNITVYDMEFLGGMEAAGFIAGNFPGISLQHTALADGGDGALNNHKYASVLKDADFLINVFSPRGHTQPPAGSRFTLGFKSHIGTYASEYRNEGPSLHTSLMTNLREMNCTGPVYKKNVLSVCSGIWAMNEGNGPGGRAENYSTYAKTMDASISGTAAPSTTITLSTDPLTAEMQAIRMMRLNKGGKYDVDSLPPYLQSSAGMTGKMEGTTYNIGVIDEAKMDIRRVINDVTLIERKAPYHSAGSAPISVTTLRGDTTFIEFSLPGKRWGGKASIVIHGIDGTLMHRRELPLLGVRNHFSWDNRGMNGVRAGRGTYIVRMSCGEVCLSKQFVLLS
ncbi:MAG: DUF362 domain-containing protein [Chitinispirillaceae bacterium]|nr:DUF362 domain-containing protein [Chitinispirillaceae bacterium]